MDLCADDRVTDHGVEIAIDVDEVMSREVNEVNFVDLEDLNATINLEEPNSNLERKAQSSSSTSTQSQRRKIKEKELMVASMKYVVEFFKRLTHVYSDKVDENKIKEVLDEVCLMSNLTKK